MIPIRVGSGYDSHRFEAGKPLVLGGCVFPGEDGLKAHSDGDVVIHAIIDALFGAAGLGDIGAHFPDTDERWRGADSAALLAAAVEEVTAAGWRLGNIDVTIICERPRIRPRVDDMRRRLASLLKCDEAAVSIKGKTNEKMDDVGAGVGIAVYATCLIASRG